MLLLPINCYYVTLSLKICVTLSLKKNYYV